MNSTEVENFIIYNLNYKNKLITEDFINDIMLRFKINTLRKKNYKINNLNYFITATTHKTYTIDLKDIEYKYYKQKFENENKNIVFLRQDNYEKLEFLGDAILKPILTQYIMEFYENENEGFLSKLRSKLEKTKTFSTLTRILNLKDYILISREYEETNTRKTNNNIMEDVFEAFIGALFKDATEQKDEGYAFKLIHDLIFNIFENEVYGIDLQELSVDDNYKDQLNAFCNSNKLPTPKYILKNTKEVNKTRGNNVYKTTLYFSIVQVQGYKEQGSGNNKKEAEQEAAKKLLQKLKS